MRFHRWIVLALLAVGSVLAVGQQAVADDAQVAGSIADQLNARWAPNSPAFSAESVAQQRGPDKFGGFGGVRIGNLISIAVAKATLANQTNPTPQEALQALIDAQQAVMTERQGQGQKGWGRISQDLTGQKLGHWMKDAQPATAAVTGQSLSTGKSAKEPGQSPGKATGKIDPASSKTFDTSALHSTGVVVSGPGVGGEPGRGPGKDVSGKDVSGKDVAGKDVAGGPGEGGGHGGGNGGSGGGGKGK